MPQLRILSYLPNPRLWKATIAARYCGVEIEILGASPGELAKWLWDFNAKPIDQVDPAAAEAAKRTGRVGFKNRTLYKTDAFLAANPFGTVPVGFSSDGQIGIFESNSIMRAVARLGAETYPLYGVGPYEASRIDSFLDVSLVFAREAQRYLLALSGRSISDEIYALMSDAFDTYMLGLEQALQSREVLAGSQVTLADICFACELALFQNEGARGGHLETQGRAPILSGARDRFPRTLSHFDHLLARPEFAPDLGAYIAKLTTARP
jgi:glutathione S-transferase